MIQQCPLHRERHPRYLQRCTLTGKIDSLCKHCSLRLACTLFICFFFIRFCQRIRKDRESCLLFYLLPILLSSYALSEYTPKEYTLAFITNMSYSLLLFFTFLFHLLVTGIFWGPLFSLHRSLEVFDKKEFIKIVKTLAANLALPMRLLMPACVLLLLLSSLFYPNKSSFGFCLTLMSFVSMAISLMITLAVQVPIVSGILQWTKGEAPSHWEAIRDRWVRFHVWRTGAALLSFGCLIGAVLFF